MIFSFSTVVDTSLYYSKGKEMDRIQEAGERNNSQCPPTSAVALAIKGNKKSKYVVQWALNKFVPEGMIIFKLIHVHAGIKGVPTPSNIYVCFMLVFKKVVFSIHLKFTNIFLYWKLLSAMITEQSHLYPEEIGM